MGVCGIVESLFCYPFLLFGLLFHIIALRLQRKKKNLSSYSNRKESIITNKINRDIEINTEQKQRERGGKAGRQAGKSKLLNFVKTVIVNK